MKLVMLVKVNVYVYIQLTYPSLLVHL